MTWTPGGGQRVENSQKTAVSAEGTRATPVSSTVRRNGYDFGVSVPSSRADSCTSPLIPTIDGILRSRQRLGAGHPIQGFLRHPRLLAASPSVIVPSRRVTNQGRRTLVAPERRISGKLATFAAAGVEADAARRTSTGPTTVAMHLDDTVRSLRSAPSAILPFCSPESRHRIPLICIPPSDGGIHLSELSDFLAPPQRPSPSRSPNPSPSVDHKRLA